ncbi:MAG: AAA family ATPase [Pseudomonadota bacterium]
MSAPDGDRRWTAILSADMVGFTDTARRIGPEKAYDLLDRVMSLVSERIGAEGGHVIDTAGDGLLAAFGAPEAIENASLRACRAGLSIQEALEREKSEFEMDFDAAPQLRIALAGGNALVAMAPLGGVKLVGDPINLAARLQAEAAPGTVLLNTTIQDETAGHVDTESLGTFMLKGFDEPVPGYRLTGLTEGATLFEAAANRGQGRFVSRKADLARLIDVVGSEARTAIVTGPPGIGKSRLAFEALADLETRHAIYAGQCAQSGGRVAYAPLMDCLRQAAGTAPRASRKETLSAVTDRFPGIVGSDELNRFLDQHSEQFDPLERSLADREFLVRIFSGLANAGGILVVEDVHWVDASTGSVLAALAERALPMILTCRPDFAASWFQHPNVTLIELSALEDQDIQAIAEDRLRGTLSPGLAAFFASKSDGVPLVAEEIVRALDQGARLRQSDDGLTLSEPDGTILTGNLEQLVLSRIEHLSPDQKATLRMAATIGRDFSEDLLEAALGRSPGLTEMAAQPGLLEPAGPGECRFAHALIRDAVYEGLLSTHRKSAHLAVAEAMGKTDGAENFAALASHYLASPHPERATKPLLEAARESLRAADMLDVDARLETAYGFVAADPDLLNDADYRSLAVSWLRALELIGDFTRLEAIGEKLMPRMMRGPYSPELGIFQTLMAIALCHTRDYREAQALAERTQREAEAHGDTWGAAWSKVPLMRIYDETGWKGWQEIEVLAGEIAPVAEARGDNHLAMSARYLLCSGYRSSGFRGKALEVADEIKRFSETHNERRAAGYSRWARAMIYAIEGNPEAARSVLEDGRSEAIPGSADERVSDGIALFSAALLDAPGAVRPKVERLRAESRALGDLNITNGMEYVRALIEIRAGRLAMAWRLLTDNIPILEREENTNFIRQFYVTRAEVSLAVLKLIDPSAEAPPGRTQPQKSRPSISDIARFFSLKLFGKDWAERDYLACLNYERSDQGAHFARCHIGLGLIAGARNDHRKAKYHLETGLRAAEEEDLKLLAARARKSLAKFVDNRASDIAKGDV